MIEFIASVVTGWLFFTIVFDMGKEDAKREAAERNRYNA